MKKTYFLIALAILGVPAFYLLHAQAARDSAQYLGLAHINIQTKDLEKSLNFYLDNLHFSVVDRSEKTLPAGTMKTSLIKLGSCILELSQPPNPDNAIEKFPGVIGHFAIEVKDVDKAAAELKTKGIQLDREVSSSNLFGGIRITFISGPSGESIELLEYTNPKSKAAQAR
jgi:catechol 2,3-dioxygenase-like lactoylglutathione lyase family enzyme